MSDTYDPQHVQYGQSYYLQPEGSDPYAAYRTLYGSSRSESSPPHVEATNSYPTYMAAAVSKSNIRDTTRTPSPTPSETVLLRGPDPMSMKLVMEKVRELWYWIQETKNIPYAIMIVVVVIARILSIVYNQDIINAILPAGTKIKDLTAGWLVFTTILIILSFPPLFGQDFIATLLGLFYGLWPGFGIFCLGTFLGEILNYYISGWCCRRRDEKLERRDISYGALVHAVREGGLKVAIMARLSIIPAHFTTTAFSAWGLNIVVLLIATIVTLPKPFVTVYRGVFYESNPAKYKSIFYADVAVTTVSTIVAIIAYVYIRRKTEQVTPDVIYGRRKGRQARLQYARSFDHEESPYTWKPYNSESDYAFTSQPEGGGTVHPETSLPVQAQVARGQLMQSQQQDQEEQGRFGMDGRGYHEGYYGLGGRAAGYSADPSLAANANTNVNVYANVNPYARARGSHAWTQVDGHGHADSYGLGRAYVLPPGAAGRTSTSGWRAAGPQGSG